MILQVVLEHSYGGIFNTETQRTQRFTERGKFLGPTFSSQAIAYKERFFPEKGILSLYELSTSSFSEKKSLLVGDPSGRKRR